MDSTEILGLAMGVVMISVVTEITDAGGIKEEYTVKSKEGQA